MNRFRHAGVLVWLAQLGLGCTALVGGDGDETTGSEDATGGATESPSSASSGAITTGTTPQTVTSSTPTSSSGVGEGTDETSTGNTSPGPGGEAFIGTDVPPPLVECSTWEQDCPRGQKCMVWANDGGNSWNAMGCFPLDPDPDGAGESCTVEGSGVSGIDSCELGAMCFNVDNETLIGECVPFCVGDESNPTCEDPGRSCSISSGPLALCLAHCDPLGDDCAEAQGCYGVDDIFWCVPDASGEAGAYPDACEYVNACDPGLSCANGTYVPGCEASGCCTPFCDLNAPVCPAMGLACVPYFEPGDAPAGYENVGFCGVDPG